MGFAQAAQIADRMAQTAPEVVESPKNYVIPLRYAYGSKRRKAKRLASQAKGLYGVEYSQGSADRVGCIPGETFILASGPKRALRLFNDFVKPDGSLYINRTVRRICGVTAGTKERIL